jgi:hypothetical protein
MMDDDYDYTPFLAQIIMDRFQAKVVDFIPTKTTNNKEIILSDIFDYFEGILEAFDELNTQEEVDIYIMMKELRNSSSCYSIPNSQPNIRGFEVQVWSNDESEIGGRRLSHPMFIYLNFDGIYLKGKRINDEYLKIPSLDSSKKDNIHEYMCEVLELILNHLFSKANLYKDHQISIDYQPLSSFLKLTW